MSEACCGKCMERLAGAWEQGAAKAWGHGIENYLTPGFVPYSIRRQNPYRKETP